MRRGSDAKALAGCLRFGWKTEVEYDEFPLGLSEDIVRAISAKKNEPDWLLDFRLRAYRRWLTMKEPDWSDNRCGSCAVASATTSCKSSTHPYSAVQRRPIWEFLLGYRLDLLGQCHLLGSLRFGLPGKYHFLGTDP